MTDTKMKTLDLSLDTDTKMKIQQNVRFLRKLFNLEYNNILVFLENYSIYSTTHWQGCVGRNRYISIHANIE